MATGSAEDTFSHVCRDRLGYFTPEDFKISSCSLCYFYLVVQSPQFILDHDLVVRFFHTKPYLLRRNDTHLAKNSSDVYLAFDNQTAIDVICETLDDVMCSGIVTCCKTAWDCCLNQIRNKPPDDSVRYCPQTFDGWDCWDFSPPNRTTFQQCPSFLSSAKGSKSSKVCDGNGAWQIDTSTGLEYTEYGTCTDEDKIAAYRTPIIVGLVCNIIGIILLIPAISIYTMYRSLRKQHRIKIHINFFLSILLTNILCLIWDVVVRLDRLDTDRDNSFLHAYQSMCKCLHVLHRFARASMFFWMCCEGFFLHRLLVNAFSPPKRFYGYVLYGWGLPILLCCVYSCLRKLIADDSVCWILPLEGANEALDWVIIYSPAIACIIVNTLFLLRILKLLLQKTAKHPNEPNNFRRVIKATFILVPLFGIHQFCLIYRPDPEREPEYKIYEISSAIILNSQGIISSLLFCYFNMEVQSLLKLTFKRLGRRYSTRRTKDGRKLSLSLTMTSRRTSVSSLQNGGIVAIGLHEQAKNIPLHETLYGTGTEARTATHVENPNNTHMKRCKIDADSENKNNCVNNLAFTDDEEIQESIRL